MRYKNPEAQESGLIIKPPSITPLALSTEVDEAIFCRFRSDHIVDRLTERRAFDGRKILMQHYLLIDGGFSGLSQNRDFELSSVLMSCR